MKTNRLIGDSGGTSTNWCRINGEGKEEYFETESYHPVNFGENFFERMFAYWEKQNLCGVELYFYGAGCGSQENKDLLTTHFESLGWRIIELESDALGACKAYFDTGSGFLAIMGTGSVVMQYQNLRIEKQFGGLGHLIGDEGSGYYFGKLLLETWFQDGLSGSLADRLEKNLGKKNAVVQQLNGASGKKLLSALAEQTSKWTEFEEIEQLHEKNIRLFLEMQLLPALQDAEPTEMGTVQLVIVGGYAHAKRELLQKILHEHQIFDFQIDKTPLKKMVNRIGKK